MIFKKKYVIILSGVSRCDGIGRRAGLKIQSWRQGAGSTPATGTKIDILRLKSVDFCFDVKLTLQIINKIIKPNSYFELGFCILLNCFVIFLFFNNSFDPIYNEFNIHKPIGCCDNWECCKQVEIGVWKNAPEEFQSGIAAGTGCEHVVYVRYDGLAVDVCKLVNCNVIVYPKIYKMSEGVNRKGDTDAGKYVLGVSFYNAEFDEQERNAKLKGMCKEIASENHAEYSVICLKRIEDQSKACAKAIKRKHVSENLAFGKYKNG